MSVSSLQDTHGERRKETVKAPNKKSPAAKLSPKPPKEKVVKPKKEVIKPGKPAKPDPTAKAKGAGHQPGVVRGITYYKAAKPAEDEHRGGERVGRASVCSQGVFTEHRGNSSKHCARTTFPSVSAPLWVGDANLI